MNNLLSGKGGGTVNMGKKRLRNEDEFRKLGFMTPKNPAQDFQKPPGMLALKLMFQFAKDKPDIFNKLVMESTYRGDGCPYALRYE